MGPGFATQCSRILHSSLELMPLYGGNKALMHAQLPTQGTDSGVRGDTNLGKVLRFSSSRCPIAEPSMDSSGMMVFAACRKRGSGDQPAILVYCHRHREHNNGMHSLRSHAPIWVLLKGGRADEVLQPRAQIVESRVQRLLYWWTPRKCCQSSPMRGRTFHAAKAPKAFRGPRSNMELANPAT